MAESRGAGLAGAPGARLDGTESRLLVLTRLVLRLTVLTAARGGLEVEGMAQVPPRGPLLLCSNHLSNFDPLVYAGIVPRVLHALTKAELYRNPVMRSFLLHCNCIPIRREMADRAALRTGLAVLRSGGALMLFPEGHRSPRGRLLPFAPGAAYLALRSGALVLPSAVWGTESVLPKGHLVPRRAPISVRFGAPFCPLSREPVQAAREIQERVAALLPEPYCRLADAD